MMVGRFVDVFGVYVAWCRGQFFVLDTYTGRGVVSKIGDLPPRRLRMDRLVLAASPALLVRYNATPRPRVEMEMLP